MEIARCGEDEVERHGADVGGISHPLSRRTTHNPRQSPISSAWSAKSIVLDDGNTFVMAVAPSTRHLCLGKSRRQMRRKLRCAPQPNRSACICVHHKRATVRH